MVYASRTTSPVGNFVARNATYVAYQYSTPGTATATYYEKNEDGTTNFGAWMYTRADLMAAFSGARLFKDNQVLFSSISDLVSAMNTLDWWVGSSANSISSNPNEVLINLKRTIRVGVVGNDYNLITFTLVKRTAADTSPGDESGTYWIVTDNRLSQELKVDTSDWYGDANTHSVYGYGLAEVQVSRI